MESHRKSRQAAQAVALTSRSRDGIRISWPQTPPGPGRREQGRWRFHERKVRQLYAMPMAELPRGLARPLRKRWPGAAPAAADLPPAGVLTQSSGH